MTNKSETWECLICAASITVDPRDHAILQLPQDKWTALVTWSGKLTRYLCPEHNPMRSVDVEMQYLPRWMSLSTHDWFNDGCPTCGHQILLTDADYDLIARLHAHRINVALEGEGDEPFEFTTQDLKNYIVHLRETNWNAPHTHGPEGEIIYEDEDH